jgi:hypothetical protein
MNKYLIPTAIILVSVMCFITFSTIASAANQSTTYATVYVMNTLPHIQTVTASPDPAVPSDVMTVKSNVSDVNGDLDVVWAKYYNTTMGLVGTVSLTYNATSKLYADYTFTIPADAIGGTWNVTVYANDTYGTSSKSTTFTVNSVIAMTLQNTPIDFGNSSVGVANRRAENGTAIAGSYRGVVEGFPLIVNNTGNTKNNYTISGLDLVGQTNGAYKIGVSNVTYKLTSTPSGTALTGVDTLYSGNNNAKSVVNTYFWINVPTGIPQQQYKGNVTIKASRS